MSDHGIKCDKSGKVLPGALTNNFSAEFSYDGGGNKQTYRSTLAPKYLRDLETRIATLLEEFLSEQPEVKEEEPSE